MKDILKRIFGHCPECGRWFTFPRYRREITLYEHDNDNFLYSCKRCYKERDEKWEGLFKEIR